MWPKFWLLENNKASVVSIPTSRMAEDFVEDLLEGPLFLEVPLPWPHHCLAVETAPTSHMVEAAVEHGATAEGRQLHKTVLMTCIVLAGGNLVVAIIEDGAEAMSKRHMAVCR